MSLEEISCCRVDLPTPADLLSSASRAYVGNHRQDAFRLPGSKL